MRHLLVALLAAASLAAAPAILAKEVTFKPNAQGQIEFQTPSGNIGCIYTPEGGTDVYEPVDGGRNSSAIASNRTMSA